MKNKTKKAGMALLILSALLAAYPLVSSWLIRMQDARLYEDWQKVRQGASLEEKEAQKERAASWNRRLNQAQITFTPQELEEYRQLMSLDLSGTLGWISIPKLEISLPISHTTDESVLSAGAGHFENSSLPLGMKGDHAVISAHSGLASAALFSSLNRLETGDSFTITTLFDTMTYTVTDKETVLPDQTESLKTDPDLDQVTLVTCTPYGVNSHRLLVHAVRNPMEQAFIKPDPSISFWLILLAGLGLLWIFGMCRRHAKPQ